MTSHAQERLPKGPHGLTRDEVQASQRERILDAVLDVVGEHGYAATTVADITTAAAISRTTFYELFHNKQEAFLTAYDAFGKRFLIDMVGVPITTPADSISAAAARLAELGRTRPAACRAFLIDILAVGEEGLEHRDRMMGRAEQQFHLVSGWVRSMEPNLPRPPNFVARAVVAASWEITAQHIRTPGDTMAESHEALDLHLAARSHG